MKKGKLSKYKQITIELYGYSCWAEMSGNVLISEIDIKDKDGKIKAKVDTLAEAEAWIFSNKK